MPPFEYSYSNISIGFTLGYGLSIPATAIRDEADEPILDESGDYILDEN